MDGKRERKSSWWNQLMQIRWSSTRPAHANANAPVQIPTSVLPDDAALRRYSSVAPVVSEPE